MDFFERFGLPVTLRVDEEDVRRRYYRLSREFHPDFFSGADEAARQQALEQSALINRAYKTLLDPDQLLGYVLSQKGLLAENEKYSLAPEFLMDMLDLNERTMELNRRDENAVNAVKAEAKNMLSAEHQKIEPIIQAYDDRSVTGEELAALKEYYYRKKYLDRIADSLQNN